MFLTCLRRNGPRWGPSAPGGRWSEGFAIGVTPVDGFRQAVTSLEHGCLFVSCDITGEGHRLIARELGHYLAELVR